MNYVYSGKIEVWNIPKETDAIREAINKLIEEETYKDWTKYIEAVNFSNSLRNRMDGYDFNGDYDDMTDMEDFFYSVMKAVMELYPGSSMDAHFCGWNRTTGTETAFTTQLRSGHVREVDFEFNDDRLLCPNPDCDNGFVSFGNIEFDTEYDCDECGRHISVDEVNEILSEFVEEYDLEIDENGSFEKNNETVSNIKLDFVGKKFVTTGLSIDDENWVKEEVESRGGEFKPRFVVSLDYLIYNPNYDHETTKYTRTKEQIEKGKPVQVISYEDFKRSL